MAVSYQLSVGIASSVRADCTYTPKPAACVKAGSFCLYREGSTTGAFSEGVL